MRLHDHVLSLNTFSSSSFSPPSSLSIPCPQSEAEARRGGATGQQPTGDFDATSPNRRSEPNLANPASEQEESLPADEKAIVEGGALRLYRASCDKDGPLVIRQMGQYIAAGVGGVLGPGRLGRQLQMASTIDCVYLRLMTEHRLASCCL